jgi:hypothetical protein
VIRRRLAVVLVGLVAAGGVASLPAAHAAETPVAATAVEATPPLCVWLDVVNLAYCVRR